MFNGLRVLEVATWTLVPAAAAVLADFGADVIKIEHPVRGDPQRGLATGGVAPSLNGVSVTMEQTNRGKRSVGLDISTPEGLALLYRLAEQSDVFMTSFLPDNRAKLGIDVGHIREVNPDIIYVRADAVGRSGPDAGKPGYDMSAFWARGGIAHALTDPAWDHPVRQRPGFGDKTGAMNIAFGVAAALYRRERTGTPTVVDVSLLGTALWVNSSDVVYSKAIGGDFSRKEIKVTNPIGHYYRTADGRWIALLMLESDRWWAPLCRHIGREDLLSDSRFGDAAGRTAHAAECVRELAVTFASATLAEWRERLAPLKGPWEAMLTLPEVLEDPQVVANGYIADVKHPSGQDVTLVRAPVQFDGELPDLRSAPEAAAHTEEVLIELGYSWEEIGQYKECGAIA
ncbi:crotonobetainyl-CoA:carnitine CoA-transferase CaiB-like acyl-CoA transferase [Streptosporangium album]|uniref:Crotonobetainyl-CoA:carnitine CoA-transferase CaiB-like acyl-CoA transferase n=1 Tax=Streptosporangium album TaxID=47479 RepID=A0A7W7S6L0_9ACTN|nr:CoA transferase [Streptosporangium album]MBB4944183.1 crotonobetainyl-CoA:carnitine CoA-transferase CaiB-like acyl-CoA transferase [Streptosporangium album]